jgi:hypothetical protein
MAAASPGTQTSTFVNKFIGTPSEPGTMDDPTLQRRLDAIELRQNVILALLILPYLVGAGGLLLQWGGLGVVVVGVILVVLGGFYLGAQERRPSRR